MTLDAKTDFGCEYFAHFCYRQRQPRIIGKIKRAKEYGPDDYRLIYDYLNLFDEIVILPNTITETSNLLDHVKGERRQACMSVLTAITKAGSEQFIRSADAAEQPEFMELGVMDCAILCALKADTYLLTADLDLYIAASCRAPEAQYFDYLRDSRW